MPDVYNVLAEIISVSISDIIGMSMNYSSNSIKRRIEKQILKNKIRKRAEYLKRKYKDSFERLNKMDTGSLFEWIKEEGTIKRILIFSNAEDTSNISTEQMRHYKENFFIDAFNIAQTHDLREKEKLREVLNDLFRYVDELFWKSLDEKDVFIYKKSVLEIGQTVSKFAEDIIREIRYHGSFAEYLDSQKVLQEVSFRLDYHSKDIPFVGRESEFEKIDAFCASQEQISWWVILGKGGSGKSRLVYEYIKKNINSSDWKMCFLHGDFFDPVGGGKCKIWNTWTYDKNLLLAVDYVKKYAKEVAQWIEALSRNNSITRKIRILLLERPSGEKPLWIREGFDNPVVESLKYDEDFLKLPSLDNDLILFAIKYAEKNKKQISEADAIDAWNKLKTIDSDTRILYFIMILEAAFNNGPWRNWNRDDDLVGYIVRRELANIAVRFDNKKNVIRSFNRLLAFCTATKGLPIFELPQSIPELIKNELKEISNNTGDKNELCSSMQLEGGILQPIKPDIIGEYMVLYIIEQYFLYKEEKEEFIKKLWIYDSSNFQFFIYRLFQDKMNKGSYNDIIKLMLFDTVPYDNIFVMEDYSNLMRDLTVISDLDQVLTYTEILEKIYQIYPLNKVIVCSYANGLLNLSCKQKLSERKETIGKLERLAVVHAENVEIQTVYACGLFNLSYGQELLERKETIRRLERHAMLYTDNAVIQIICAHGLFNLSIDREFLVRKEVTEKLCHLAEDHTNNIEVQILYAKSLFNLGNDQGLIIKKEVSEKLSHLAKNHINNIEVQIAYAKSLYNLGIDQELLMKEETVERLSHLAEKYVDNVEIQILYAYGLLNLSSEQRLLESEETIGKLENLASRYIDNVEIQTLYAQGLVNISSKQRLPEREKTIEKLEHLSKKHTNSGDIQIAYVNGLGHLSNLQEPPELEETIGKLEHLTAEYADNIDIQIVYAKVLVTLCGMQDLSEKEITIGKLEHLIVEYPNNANILTEYAKGLVNLSVVQGLVEINETIRKLEHLATKNANNIDIQEVYTSGLLNLSLKQELPEIKKTIEKLEHLTVKYPNNANILTEYARGLVNLSIKQELPEIKETIEKLEHLSIKHANNVMIHIAHANGLLTLSSKQEQAETKETIEKLEHLSQEHADNVELETIYVYGLFVLSSKQEYPEIKETIEKLEHLSRKHVDNVMIHTAYAKSLFFLSRDQKQTEITEIIEELEHLVGEYFDNPEIRAVYTAVMVDLILGKNYETI